MLTFRTLEAGELRWIYDTYMVNDFPEEELRPFWNMKSLYDRGIYDVLLFYDQERLVGYACNVKSEAYILLDYYAIVGDCRGMGYGSMAISALKDFYREYQGLLLETEDSEEDISQEERALRLRRDRFYMRNGALKQQVKEVVFGVHFQIWQIPLQEYSVSADCARAMRELYASILPKELYDREIHVSLSEQVKGRLLEDN